MLITIEEVDKPDITADHFDSAGSMVTSKNDRMLAIANPPRDETNVAYDLKESDQWETIQFSSFESHNVLVDIDETDGPKVEGLVDLSKIVDDWSDYHEQEWPGYEVARKTGDRDSEHYREDLDERWYRRRLGIMPPAGADAHRPFDVPDVKNAFGSPTDVDSSVKPDALALDVARKGGDRNALVAKFVGRVEVLDTWKGMDHKENEAHLRDLLLDGREWRAPLVIDANGEGSGLADSVSEFYPNTERFDAGSKAAAEEDYYDKWAEGMCYLGHFLEDGGQFSNTRLREELLSAARTVEIEEKHYASRGEDGATVYKLTKKQKVKDQLGRSPDILDAAYMAVWADTDKPSAKKTLNPVW